MDKKDKRRLENSFLFKIRWFKVSYADIICLIAAVSLSIGWYRYLQVE